MKKTFQSTVHLWLPLLVGVAMLLIPLVRDLHIESALLAALTGCFWAGWRGCKKEIGQADGRRIMVMLRALYLAGFPLFVFALISGCLSWHGLGFWVLYPVPSVLFGYSLGRLFRLWDISYRRFWVAIILMVIAIGGLLIEFLTFPQVYFFNHVWGGWPGPIYDETVKVTWSLLFFRGLTLLWAALLWLVPKRPKSTAVKIGIVGCFILLAFGYTQLAEMGIISPPSYLQNRLGGVEQTKHFEIYYDAGAYTEDEVGFIAKKHEFYFEQITHRLDIEWPKDAPRIESYLYAHPWQKKSLVGAKFTSYVPVWLGQDQLHIAKQQIAGSLKHELVHVLGKQFGNQWFNASWSIGLVEGVAVAVAPDESPTTTIDQIVVSEKPYPTAQEMQHALSPLGFYGGRSAVNYTQSGSFVQYLLANYPVEATKEAYRKGDVAAAFENNFSDLVADWHEALDTVTVDSTDQRVAQRLYGFPSLFEQVCPHVQSDFARTWDRFEFYMAEKDSATALYYLDKAQSQSSENLFLKSRLAFLNLKRGNITKVQQHASIADSSVDALLLTADAFMLQNKQDSAAAYIAEAADLLRSQPDSLLQPAVTMRQDSFQWQHYRDIVYRGDVVPDSIYRVLLPRIRSRALELAIDQQNWRLLQRYAAAGLTVPANVRYFDTYEKLIDWIAFLGNEVLAEQWLQKIRNLNLRPRYRQRLQQSSEWVEFITAK